MESRADRVTGGTATQCCRRAATRPCARSADLVWFQWESHPLLTAQKLVDRLKRVLDDIEAQVVGDADEDDGEADDDEAADHDDEVDDAAMSAWDAKFKMP